MAASDRVRALVACARRLADPNDPLGQRAREQLPASTGLSPENVELALSEILETHPSDAELLALSTCAIPAPRVHVQLAANVFVAPLRAIAIALAQSDQVSVRASRREPVFPTLLCEASGAFELVDSLEPRPGDHLWAYGADTTLAELATRLPADVVLHAHGSGFGVAVVAGHAADAARLLVDDIVPFDQRGCLSPRVAVVIGDLEGARAFATHVARELGERRVRVPTGRSSAEERAEQVSWRDSLAFAGELMLAGEGWVAVDPSERRLLAAPAGRNLVVVRSGAELTWLGDHAASIVAVGIERTTDDALFDAVRAALPHARVSGLGQMQRPKFDGPVDRRPRTKHSLRSS
ncbi:MAG: proline dehydrogenase [Myxococcales bacterium]|nr:proline dehydrogenase [Myxococcales bacterium]